MAAAILGALGEILVISVAWATAGLVVWWGNRRAREVSFGEVAPVACGYWLFRAVGISSSIRCWNLALAAFLGGFLPILLLSWIEGSLGVGDLREALSNWQWREPWNLDLSLSFLGSVSSPLNYGLFFPTLVVVVTVFVRRIGGWVGEFHENLLARNDDGDSGLQQQFRSWAAEFEHFYKGRWGWFRWKTADPAILTLCVAFPGWAYWQIGRISCAGDGCIFGFTEGGRHSILGIFTTVVLGAVVYICCASTIVALRTLFLFRDGYRLFSDSVDVNPYHPDRSGGMRFAGQMALHVLMILSIIWVMALLLMTRDITVLPTLQPYQYVLAPSLLLITLLCFAPVREAHLLLVNAKWRVVRQLTDREGPNIQRAGDLATEEFLERLARMKQIQDAANAYPAWPLNLVQGASYAVWAVGSGIGSVVSLYELVTSWF